MDSADNKRAKRNISDGLLPKTKNIWWFVILLGITCIFLSFRSQMTGSEPYLHPVYKTVPIPSRSSDLRPTNTTTTTVKPNGHPSNTTVTEPSGSSDLRQTTNKPNGHPVNKTVLKPSLKPPSSIPPPHSYFKVISSERYQLCDTLEIYIEDYNKEIKRPKGGDYLWAWIYNKELLASATSDVIIDHKNGSYTAKFQSHWAGATVIAVSLIHSSDAISVLKYLRDNYPARCGYAGKFVSGNINSVTPCHITTDMYINDNLTKADRTFCNFTDEKTGFPWFCVKPDTLPCDTFAWHHKEQMTPFINSVLSKKQQSAMQRPVSIPSSTKIVTVESPDNKTTSRCKREELQRCSLGLPPRPSNSVAGFYYQDQWNSLVCNNSQFKVPGALTKIRKCLQNQALHFWGDSTVRQWYEYFADILKSTLDEHKAKNTKFGPHVAVDKTFNISLHYLHHGYPIQNSWTLVENIHYVPNMIDEIKNGGNEIIVLTLWAHFTPNDLPFYRQRWEAIKGAIVRLKLRNPDARIMIKSANTREPTSIDASSWYANELDKVMRDMMTGIDDVTIVDVWDMTIGHRTGFHIHPKVQVISQEIDMLLSFLCSERI